MNSQLNAQGRARPEIAALYNWRYKDLGNLPLVQSQPQYLAANPGFAFDYQMVDVPDFQVCVFCFFLFLVKRIRGGGKEGRRGCGKIIR